MKWTPDPFERPAPRYYPVPVISVTVAADRSKMVRESVDAEWLRRVIRWPLTQRTVRLAAESRPRKDAKGRKEDAEDLTLKKA